MIKSAFEKEKWNGLDTEEQMDSQKRKISFILIEMYQIVSYNIV